jgi:hypothetical protein
MITEYRQEATKYGDRYISNCGYSYGIKYQIEQHNKNCLLCRSLLGTTKAKLRSKEDILKGFLLGYRFPIDETRFKYSSDETGIKWGWSGDTYLLSLNHKIIIRNYELDPVYRGITYGHYLPDTWQLKAWIRDMNVNKKIIELPLSFLRRFQYDFIEILDIKPNKYDQDVNILFRLKMTFQDDGKDFKYFLFLDDDNKMNLIELPKEAKRVQDALLTLYPKFITNRQETLRQGDLFFEPIKDLNSDLMDKTIDKVYRNTESKEVKEYYHKYAKYPDTTICSPNTGQKTNHYSQQLTYYDVLGYQIVKGYIKHKNKDHPTLRLNPKYWYYVHQNNAINSWNIEKDGNINRD